jgi:hypothetical protein
MNVRIGRCCARDTLAACAPDTSSRSLLSRRSSPSAQVSMVALLPALLRSARAHAPLTDSLLGRQRCRQRPTRTSTMSWYSGSASASVFSPRTRRSTCGQRQPPALTPSEPSHHGLHHGRVCNLLSALLLTKPLQKQTENSAQGYTCSAQDTSASVVRRGQPAMAGTAPPRAAPPGSAGAACRAARGARSGPCRSGRAPHSSRACPAAAAPRRG